jgi:hypothetical protein
MKLVVLDSLCHSCDGAQECQGDIAAWKATGSTQTLQNAVKAGLKPSLTLDDRLGTALHLAANSSYLEVRHTVLMIQAHESTCLTEYRS